MNLLSNMIPYDSQDGARASQAPPLLVALGGTSTVVVQEGMLLSAGVQGRTEAVHEKEESSTLCLSAMGCLVDHDGERQDDARYLQYLQYQRFCEM